MSDYVNYDDLARLEYGRLLWRNPILRQRLLDHWSDSRHPYRERFLQHRELVDLILQTSESDESVEARLATRGTTLRAMVREIPPVFGSFWRC
jgi:hypothetical protein